MSLLLMISLVACQHPEEGGEQGGNHIVVCFDRYAPKPYRTPAGVSHMPMPKVLYTDSVGMLVDAVPDGVCDTLSLYSPGEFKELALSYRNFEYTYYPLLRGDTVTVSLDSLDYPVLTSKHHPERNRIYNMNRSLREGKTHLGLEAKTCLGSDWVRIAQTIDVIRANNWSLLLDYCPLDSLEAMFSRYRQDYADSIARFKAQRLISDDVYNRYQYLLELKVYESRRMLNEDTAFYRRMEAGISDEYLAFPSYYEYQDYYLGYLNRHIPIVSQAQGGCKDWRKTFDELALKPFPKGSKRALLKRCVQEIGDNFSAQDVNRYLDRYLDMTRDTATYSQVIAQYNLSADAGKLLLKDVQGRATSLNRLLEKHKGKVVYLDFWASWCLPCREEMPPSAKLRERYGGKDVVFVYLAYNDREDSWKKAVEQEGLAGVEHCYLITNSKNSAVLERLKLETIPRYLIFDKKGRLAEFNAPRPSDRQITVVLDKYLSSGR